MAASKGQTCPSESAAPPHSRRQQVECCSYLPPDRVPLNTGHYMGESRDWAHELDAVEVGTKSLAGAGE